MKDHDKQARVIASGFILLGVIAVLTIHFLYGVDLI